MTWTPENNTTIWALLTDEQKEAMKAAKYGLLVCSISLYGVEWFDHTLSTFCREAIHRAKPAPKWEPPAELWALLRPDIVAIARDENERWWAYTCLPVDGGRLWGPDEVVYSIDALNLPDIPWEESLFLRPGRE